MRFVWFSLGCLSVHGNIIPKLPSDNKKVKADKKKNLKNLSSKDKSF
jgi:hypothetical protein